MLLICLVEEKKGVVCNAKNSSCFGCETIILGTVKLFKVVVFLEESK